tara:strand:+ start:319 stop:558 length:240 start_codon:yes stop_codon:yes gene_type:complete
VKIGPVHARSVALVTDVSLIPKKNKEKCIPKKKPAIKTALSLGLLFLLVFEEAHEKIQSKTPDKSILQKAKVKAGMEET